MSARGGILCVIAVACSGTPRPSTPTKTAQPATPVNTTRTAPPPIASSDDWRSCRVDDDCKIFTSCCAHCSANGVVLSVNKAHQGIGVERTFTLYCPACAEGACSAPEPHYQPICKHGACAVRETIEDGGRTSTVEVDDPAELGPPDPTVELLMRLGLRICRRAETCGVAPPAECDELVVPTTVTCDALDRCLASIDRLPCSSTFDLGVLDGHKLPDCDTVDRCVPQH